MEMRLKLWTTMAITLTAMACGGTTGGGGGGFFYADGAAGLGDVSTPTDAQAGGDANSTTGGDAQGGSDGSTLTDTTTATTFATCTEASQCVQDACKAAWSITCGSGCAPKMSTAAAPTGNALLNCISQKCVQGACVGSLGADPTCMDDCTATACGAELVACWEQGATKGTQGCSSAIACLDACKSDPKKFTCQAGCYNALDATGATQFKALSTCLTKSGGKPDACSKETLVCLGDGKSGTASCYDVAKCSQACGKDDTTCQGKCLASGSATAQSQLQALLTCVSAGDSSKCLPQTATCATPSGSANCQATGECVAACPTGDASAGCVLDCLHGGTKKGTDALVKLTPCMLKNCPSCGNNCQSCATSKCLNDAIACGSN